MYSGTTLTPMSGRIFGAHQKIDRLAREALRRVLIYDASFPAIKHILHFEGVNGPDAIKRKSPAQDEPWHYYAPFNAADTQLIQLIEHHYDQLAESLKKADTVRAGFEAAWLAHALVDGLTPPHHLPYEEQLAELRGGAGRETRDTIKNKLIMPGDTPLKQVRNNWKMWGPQGVLTSHGFFEFGIATMIKPITISRVALRSQDITDLHEYGVLELFRRTAKEVAAMNMFEAYQAHGWTPNLVSRARRLLIPLIVRMVALAWYAACIDAGLAEKGQHTV
jgi:hypothetical protein